MSDRKNSPVPGSLAEVLLRGRAKDMPNAAPVRPGRQLDLLFSSMAEPVQSAPPRRIATSPEALGAAATPHMDLARAAERKIWSIRELVAGVRRRLEHDFESVWVEGEISNCRPAASGHVYLTLKDGDAQLAVVLFRAQAALLRFRPQDGLAVLVRGRVSVYDQRGQLQLIAETMEPRGAGALQLAFEQLKARLMAEGLFEASRKRPLPQFPRCLGVVTSPAGAVLHDIIRVVRRRHAALHLLVYPTAVQGPGCAASVAAGVRWFNANPGRVDVILIARGGGSMEDLAGFNDEALARAIAASELPVISAVGHETDFTIADFVADLRAPTPSAAAEIVTGAQHRIEERVQELDARLRRAVRYQWMMARQRYASLAADQVLGRAREVLGRRAQRVDELDRRLETAAARKLRLVSDGMADLAGRLERQSPAVKLLLARKRLDSAEDCIRRVAVSTIGARSTRLHHASARLQALSPLAVLSRGYALVYGPNGRVLRRPGDVQSGQVIRARLAEGSVDAQVLKSSE